MMQIQEATAIKPIDLPKRIELEDAMAWAYDHLSDEYHGIFDITMSNVNASMVQKPAL